MDFLRGLLGVIAVLFIAFLFCNNKKGIRWRPIVGGLAIQFLFAFIVLKWEAGRAVLSKFTDVMNHIIGYANEGIKFLFGGLYTPDSKITFVVAFNVVPMVIFFAALIAVLYYVGVMQLFIKYIGGGISKILGTSKAESMSAAANIFVGQTEAPLVIRPFLSQLTRSELFAVLTGGLASIAGTVLASYSLLGIPMEYLLAASFMAAPAGLVIAKLFFPETENIKDREIKLEKNESANIFDAAARGAGDGLFLALNVGAMLLAFVALVAMVNGLLGYIGGLFGLEITLQGIFGYLFSPLAFAVGVPWSEAVQAGSYIGQKIVLNEFVAYIDMAKNMANLTPKTVAILSFALCGFANFGSMAMLIGGLGTLVPERRSEIAQVGMKVIFAGTLASLLNGAIAGMFL
ncbi:NupC/NupG family nucleoside CNT transporter [Brevibacillus sp. 7WMA2]|uniref:Nucleoside permease n=1 Tax=Brevibacillus laterosporus LMG 15441 TaxID=1042163 RepID=A0A075RBN8_BRELA|nr:MULTISPECIES: NupC/NupG family nucleoside CNT transporter [Brevibacillus]AIG26925.1 nucleoside permease NupX [Brevibacillus laterosporus LMG 15441]AUM65340.1 NupC/NupG family nucleoside CNT transporter [Brevibacillus laterosporus]AYK08349.1 NupC/NupG family nucleoside CNT transporter [Brevibacillus laterosporus]ERM16049.1 nucleoside transporter NupC [Brevibacillus laterosporus PE36]MBA4534550.1 NupC/NupG family nucleoside CNT transporter [Brevibacillus halotolerans]